MSAFIQCLGLPGGSVMRLVQEVPFSYQTKLHASVNPSFDGAVFSGLGVLG